MDQKRLSENPRIGENWLLRNDGRYLVAYESIIDNFRYHVFTPAEAMIALMCDGSASLAEIRDGFFRIFGLNGENDVELDERFGRAADRLYAVPGLLKEDGAASFSLQGDKERLIPNFSSYRMPENRLDFPLFVTLGFTNCCGRDCIYCYAEREKCREHPLEKWVAVMNQLSQVGVTLTDIGGGDIFMRSDAMEILTEMAARDFTFFISTKNFISRESAERLYRLGVGREDSPRHLRRPIQFSIDSVNSEIASRLVHCPDYLDIASKTVSNLVGAGMSPRVKAILTAENADAAEGVIRHFYQLGAVEFHFAQYNRSFYRHHDSLFLSWDQKMKLKEDAERLTALFPGLKLNFQLSVYTGGSRNVDWERWRKRSSCSGGRTKMLIKPDGDVVLCEQTPHAPVFVVGNVFEEGVTGVWNSHKLLDFIAPERERFKGSVCFSCPEFNSCRTVKGYCFRDAYFSYGTIYDAPPECPRQDKPPVRDI